MTNPLGVLLSSETFPATAAGYRASPAWVGTFGTLRQAGVECASSSGAALALMVPERTPLFVCDRLLAPRYRVAASPTGATSP